MDKERYEQIYQILTERQSATVPYLSKRLFVSEATIRRDLVAMEQSGMIQRVWGGAMIPGFTRDIPSFVREKTNYDQKSRIAAIASRLVREGSTLFVDGSTTCRHLVPWLAERRQLAVITFSLSLSLMLGQQADVNVHLLGGQVFEKNMVTGHAAVQSIRNYYADYLFFSCSGISAANGIMCVESRVCELLREMMQHCRKRVLLCDASKANKYAMWRLAALEDMDYVIMDRSPDDPELVRVLGDRLIVDESQLR